MTILHRLRIAIVLLVGVFLYGTLGQYVFLHSEFSILECGHRTIIMLATINEPFSADELMKYGLNTPAYRTFMLSLVIFGIAVILFSLSTITAFFVEGQLQALLRLRKMSKEISKLSNHFIIVGAGETGLYIANELKTSEHAFVVIEHDPDRIEKLEHEGYYYVRGDASEDEVLQEAGIERAKGMVVALPSDKENLFVTLTARQINPALRIIAKGIETKTDKKLLKAGANKVVNPAMIGGMRMASELIRPSVVTFMDKMLRDPLEPTRIEEVIIHKDSELENETIASSKFRQRTGLQVVAIKQPEDTSFSYDPQAEAELKDRTTLVVIGRTTDVAKARKMAGML